MIIKKNSRENRREFLNKLYNRFFKAVNLHLDHFLKKYRKEISCAPLPSSNTLNGELYWSNA